MTDTAGEHWVSVPHRTALTRGHGDTVARHEEYVLANSFSDDADITLLWIIIRDHLIMGACRMSIHLCLARHLDLALSYLVRA